MKTILVISMLLGSMSQAAFAISQSINEDFSHGIPAEWGVYDLDGNTPSKDGQVAGFAVGEGWIALNDNGNGVAASTSWYSPAGTANDWLVTPAISIDNGTYVVQWKTRAHNTNYADGYSVYVSATGNEPENFIDEPIFQLDSESGEWTAHEVSLEAYEGQTVWVAFVNDTHDKSRLYVDDVYVGASFDAFLTIDLGESTTYSLCPIRGTVNNVTDEEINGFTVDFSFNDKIYEEYFLVTIPAQGIVDFEFSQAVELPLAEITPYACSLSCNDRLQYTLEGTVACVPRTVVVEECTGTWCGYCPSGAVALEKLSEQYPTSFIGIAVHSGDDLTVEPYNSTIKSSFGISSFPTAVFNREQKMNIDELYSAVEKKMVDISPVYVTLAATYDAEDSMISATAGAKSVTDVDYPMAFAFVITEDNVVQDGLYQTNYYSGGSKEMGGWENLDSYVPSSVRPFDHVARSISEFYGNADSKIEGVKLGDEWEYSTELTMPSNVLVAENTHLIALLLDTSTKAVVNAASFDLGALIASGVESAVADKEIESVTYFDLMGRKVMNPHDGMYVKTIRYSDGTVVSSKIIMK